MQKIVSVKSEVRLDKYLSEQLNYSREFIQKLISSGLVLVNDHLEKASYKIQEKDVITIYDDDFEEDIDIVPAPMSLDIVYEDQDIMVINKPSGLVVHPGSGNYQNTLVNGLVNYTNQLSDMNGKIRPGIVHRIDKDTSGLLLIAKTNQAHQILAEDFKEKQIKREYLALLNGAFPDGSATIDAPIGRDKKNREKMAVTAENSKKAITHMKVLKRYPKYTLVSCILETGRTHQIRVHMAYIGYPVHNDPIYSKDQATSFGQFLHSYKMDFIHPITKEKMHFECPLPKEFEDFLKEIESL